MKVAKALSVAGACLTALIMISGCSPSDRTISEAQKRIDALKSKGVPDSALSRATVFLYQARDAKGRDDFGLARTSADSMRILIAQAEALYNDKINSLKPVVDDLVRRAAAMRNEVTGLQKKRLDSLLGIVDSFVRLEWYLQAESRAREITEWLPRLKFDEERTAEIRPRLTGTWVCTNVSKSEADKNVNAVEKKIFDFRTDGKVYLTENKRGQSTPLFKEDWEYYSEGTYDLAGDTVMLFINRFAARRQNFEQLSVKDGKNSWVKQTHPTYDSVITDGSQDRFVTFVDLKEDFVKQ